MTTHKDRPHDLLPCPFCGSAAAFDAEEASNGRDTYVRTWIQCSGCDMKSPNRRVAFTMHDTQRSLAEAWNKRASPVTPAAQTVAVPDGIQSVARDFEYDASTQLYTPTVVVRFAPGRRDAAETWEARDKLAWIITNAAGDTISAPATPAKAEDEERLWSLVPEPADKRLVGATRANGWNACRETIVWRLRAMLSAAQAQNKEAQ